MDINREDLKKQYFKTIKNIEYQPAFTFESFENGEYKNLVITKSAEEVYRDSLKPIVQQPTEQQILNAKLLQDNANMQLELEQQKQLNAQILLQIAGGSTND